MVKTIDQAVLFAADLLDFVGKHTEPDRQGPTEDVANADDDPIRQAIDAHDTPALYAILMEGFGYQGIADRTAREYAERHGKADWVSIEASLQSIADPCPKLEGFGTYAGCRYRKSQRTCADPGRLERCPVPTLPLRKGILSEQAFSLYLLIRDRCHGDLVQFVDALLATAAQEPDPTTIGREALIALFCGVRGVSRKLASMMLASLLERAGPARPSWRAVGSSMVAIDSLVHNHLYRTGILSAYEADHPYGNRCFGHRGCEMIIRDLAERLSIRHGVLTRAVSPRALQHAIWRFCAADEFAICNGRRIRDTGLCQQQECPLRRGCGLIPLRPPKLDEVD